MKLGDKYTKHYFKRLTLEIGNCFDKLQFIEIKNNGKNLVIEYAPRKFTSEKLFSKNMDVKCNIFLNDLLKINIEKWESEYSSKINTGHEWNLKLYFRPSIIIEKKGSNNFPNNFIELIELIKKYYSDFNVDINIRKTLNENDLLKLYCSHNSGTSFTEVSVGRIDINRNSQDRRIDIVRIKNDHYKWFRKYSKNKEDFEDLVKNNHKIELVEIKEKLNRTVIGQIIVGEYLFKKKYCVNNISKAILYHIGDELLEEFCKENEIKLIKY